ncbi:sigma-54-dependent Fis family transcriptional regulator [Vibrio sp. SCSIO 43140]|uniref:quorum-sensing sigma-54 dependent transcriptional regulator LuxO n=1 Tax=Vibrio sp. SCSIO 43140 TaxID=2819100 RepID=UPI00207618B6|nr:quorum-sensing sigma-54 dependent transcriptional regulator LuxO [Vibrio sp. SCSIO 43140]USD59311.1 sigma-54-dependent Fis family transcriptional regulator [Vibrio sp. SCSIO 43140]
MQPLIDEPKSRYLLMVEDTASVAALYRSYLSPLGIDINIVGNGRDAIQSLEHRTPDLILLDLRLPDMTGMDVLDAVKKFNPDVPIIFMTAHGSIDIAVDAMQHGAQDFLIKPCEADRLRVTVTNAIRKASKLRDEINDTGSPSYQGFIGSSQPMQAVYRTIDSAASSKASIFITGESGTGKEVCAEAIHAASKRGDKPFIAINCAAIPKDLIESELFGHVKGAFTGAAVDRQGAAELADGGTLFLDELCEMDLDLQTKLLRFIQTGTFQKVGSSRMKKVDVRFVCATNRDPWKEVQEGRFREDLYYRLYVIPLHLPPLRDREEDVIEIAYSLLGFMSHEEGKSFVRFSQDVIERFIQYEWPGNVRQLQNVLRNVVVLNHGKEITLDMLPPPLNIPVVVSKPAATITSSFGPQDIQPLWQTERRTIEQAIEACDGNIPQAAKYLDVSPSTIYRKIQAWNASENNV